MSVVGYILNMVTLGTQLRHTAQEPLRCCSDSLEGPAGQRKVDLNGGGRLQPHRNPVQDKQALF